ncbi:VOC family protein [Hymenobacter sp. H14-R3]|uniref:VOC family protein n=1 Tax=Hymenobacter sp. H14-R3 TaxID=3046308 RepID=UPI0024B95EC1|nr:VOC family protein [Hymenobacter sp. H14-R3]MDJ0365840.1 VOC family protein [Hymenobacter sp. H14-R3]
MIQQIAHVTVLVTDYDEAIAFYTQQLGFRLLTDTPLGEGKRWVLVAPGGPGGPALLLAQADGPAQQSQVGKQAAGRVFLFLTTDDFWADYQRLRANGVAFQEMPREEAHATVVVFADLCGNLWDLLQPKPAHS